ncbi:MAG: hypothetical protein P0S96_07605 [Simkaniaceae bacterium]|nr:hypothetical protein [Candidatus Sacchlamyda saccharinae]
MRILLLLLCVTVCSFGFDSWTHLELGAGNYGTRVHPRDPAVQYAVLFWTLDQLVERYGEKGIFFVNDNQKESAEYASEKLTDYALEKGYSDISVFPLIADYTTENLTSFLTPYGRTLFDTIHIKNPETNFYGRHRRENVQEQARMNTRQTLARLAKLSQSGLFLFILDTPLFLPEREKVEFIDQNLFYNETDEWEAIDYYHPNGGIIEGGRVLFIPRDAL